MSSGVATVINHKAEGIEVRVMFELPVKIVRKEKWFVASCPILDVHSQGDSEEQARSNLGEALSLFITSCFERGTLDTVLRNCGFKAKRTGFVVSDKQHASLKDEEEYLNVSIPMIAQAGTNDQYHA